MSAVAIFQPPEDTEERALKRVWRELNDVGNAHRLFDHAAGLLLWLEEEEAWIAFDGRRWTTVDGDARAIAFAHAVARGLKAEARALQAVADEKLSEVFGSWCNAETKKERVIALHAWAVKSGDAARTAAMLRQARSLMIDGGFAMRARAGDFDVDRLVYNCANGTLRFAQDGRGQWGCTFTAGHRPGDMMRQIAAMKYDPAANCPDWTDRLVVLHPDAEQRGALKLLYGSTLTGLISDQGFYVHQGKGGDGKSITNAVMGELHGDYFRSASPKTFLEGPRKSGSDHQSDIVRLAGDIRMVVADEPKDKEVWDGERIKQVTGSKVTARGAYAKDELTFAPRFKLFIECNPLPRAPSDDDGFRRRLKIFSWTVQMHKTPGLRPDPEHVVRARLMAEASGILNWLIEGCLDWLVTMKVPVGTLMSETLASYWAETSPLGDWFETWCDTSDRKHSEQATPLYNHFVEFCEAEGRAKDKIMTMTMFGRLLTNKQIIAVKGDGGRKLRRGVRLRDPEEVEALQRGLRDPAAPPPAASERSGPEEQTVRDDDDDGWVPPL